MPPSECLEYKAGRLYNSRQVPIQKMYIVHVHLQNVYKFRTVFGPVKLTNRRSLEEEEEPLKSLMSSLIDMTHFMLRFFCQYFIYRVFEVVGTK